MLTKLDGSVIKPYIAIYLPEAARQAGRGVIILTYHTTINRLAIAALPSRLDGTHIPTISQKTAGGKRLGAAHPLQPDKVARIAGIALEGQNLLAQGRIIQFVSDNEYDAQGIPVLLAWRVCLLRPGFAELVLNAGAVVVSQYTYLHHTVFLPPLHPGEGGREFQMRGLLDQYAAFINTSWRLALESLRWSRLRSHFRQARAGEEHKFGGAARVNLKLILHPWAESGDSHDRYQ